MNITPKNTLTMLSNSEKIWLQEIIKAYFNREQLDLITLRVKLYNKLEKDFDTSRLNYSLVRREVLPTLKCIWEVDPQNPILSLSDSVMKYIKTQIITNPSIRRFDASTLTFNLDYSGIDMDLCLELLYSLGLYFNSASGYPNQTVGFQNVEISSIDHITKILDFSDIETVLSNQQTFQVKPEKKISTDKIIPEVEISNTIANTAFIIMRMDKGYREGEDICNTIKEVCNLFGIIAERADDIEHSDRITDVILGKIKTSEFIIADLSGERPNVYYEIGYAHAINKRPILYRNQDSLLHFDLAGHNVPAYRNNTDLKNILTKRFEALTGKHLGKMGIE